MKLSRVRVLTTCVCAHYQMEYTLKGYTFDYMHMLVYANKNKVYLGLDRAYKTCHISPGVITKFKGRVGNFGDVSNSKLESIRAHSPCKSLSKAKPPPKHMNMHSRPEANQRHDERRVSAVRLPHVSFTGEKILLCKAHNITIKRKGIRF